MTAHPAAIAAAPLPSAPGASISVRDVTVTYANGFTAVNNASFDLDPGSICALVGVNGNISILGVNNSMNFRIPRQVFVNNATIRGNFVTEVHKHWPALVPMLQSGRLRPERFITERMPLSEGPEGYRKFDERKGGTLKAILYT